jgi:fatty-acyl-CoA synthase
VSETSAAPAPKGVMARKASLGGAVAFAILGVVILFSGPLLFRLGALDLNTATVTIEQASMWSFAAGLLAAVIGLGLALMARSHRAAIVAILSLMACGYGLGNLYGNGQLRSTLPPISDAQTDWTHPIIFSEATISARVDADAPSAGGDRPIERVGLDWHDKWAGEMYSEAQAKVYELKSITAPVQPAEALKVAAASAKRLGWTVMPPDEEAGQVEAQARTFWYGLVSDIAVRVTPDGAGSRIDIRSASRNAGADLGRNAAHVRALLNEIALAARQPD